MAVRFGVGYSTRYGITEDHWNVFRAYSSLKQLAVLIRGGKEAAIPWIREGLPAKSMKLKLCKVDRDAGLLYARTAAEQAEVFRARLGLVRGNVPGTPRVVTGRSGPGPAGTAVNIEARIWRIIVRRVRGQVENLVVEPGSGLPFTSDYDLAALIPATPSWGGPFDSTLIPLMSDVHSLSYGLGNVNFIMAPIIGELNRLLGRPDRIRHGPEAYYSGALASKEDEEETIVAFHPDLRVDTFTGSRGASILFLHELISMYHPGYRPPSA